jgi:hypothetical protein
VPEIAPRLLRDWTRDQWTRALTNASDTVRLPVCRGNLVGNQVAGRKSESLLSQVGTDHYTAGLLSQESSFHKSLLSQESPLAGGLHAAHIHLGWGSSGRSAQPRAGRSTGHRRRPLLRHDPCCHVAHRPHQDAPPGSNQDGQSARRDSYAAIAQQHSAVGVAH